MGNSVLETETDRDDEIPREILDKAKRIYRGLLPNTLVPRRGAPRAS